VQLELNLPTSQAGIILGDAAAWLLTNTSVHMSKMRVSEFRSRWMLEFETSVNYQYRDVTVAVAGDEVEISYRCHWRARDSRQLHMADPQLHEHLIGALRDFCTSTPQAE